MLISEGNDVKMANSKVIIVEGPQGVGKTTITDYIRHAIPYTNLYRLSGTADATKEGKEKARVMYEDLLEYMEKLQNKSINLLFDRTFFSEEVYCRLGFKEYSFTDAYEKLLNKLAKMDFDIYYITLFLSNENEFTRRLNREGKAKVKYIEVNRESSLNQQKEYLKLAEEIKREYKNIHVVNIDNSRNLKEVKEELKEMLK